MDEPHGIELSPDGADDRSAVLSLLNSEAWQKRLNEARASREKVLAERARSSPPKPVHSATVTRLEPLALNRPEARSFAGPMPVGYPEPQVQNDNRQPEPMDDPEEFDAEEDEDEIFAFDAEDEEADEEDWPEIPAAAIAPVLLAPVGLQKPVVSPKPAVLPGPVIATAVALPARRPLSAMTIAMGFAVGLGAGVGATSIVWLGLAGDRAAPAPLAASPAASVRATVLAQPAPPAITPVVTAPAAPLPAALPIADAPVAEAPVADPSVADAPTEPVADAPFAIAPVEDTSVADAPVASLADAPSTDAPVLPQADPLIVEVLLSPPDGAAPGNTTDSLPVISAIESVSAWQALSAAALPAPADIAGAANEGPAPLPLAGTDAPQESGVDGEASVAALLPALLASATVAWPVPLAEPAGTETAPAAMDVPPPPAEAEAPLPAVAEAQPALPALPAPVPGGPLVITMANGAIEALLTPHRVTILAPPSIADTALAQADVQVHDAGFTVSTPKRVGVTVGSNHVRYYHPEDRAVAEVLAARIGGEARDFTGADNAPTLGSIELWLEGSAPATAKVAKAKPTKKQKKPSRKAQAPREDPQLQALRDKIIRQLKNADNL